MPERSVLDVVAWDVQDRPLELSVVRGAGRLLNTLWVVGTLGAGATGAPSAPDWALPTDPDAFASLGVVRLSGRAAWLPVSGRRHLVRANQRGAWVTPEPDRRPPTRVPLEALQVSAAATTGHSRRRKHPDAPWVLTLTGGGARVELAGAWLALAFLGHLADWPEPP